MVCQYTSNFADFKAAQVLARKHKWKLALSYWFWFAVVPGLGALALIVLIIGDTTLPMYVVKHFGAGLAGFAVGSLWLGFWRPFYMRSCYKRSKAGRTDDSPIELEVTDSEIISRLPGRSEGRFFPSAIVDYAEDARIALIWLTPKNFLYIPKRALDDDQWATLRTWIYEKTGVKR